MVVRKLVLLFINDSVSCQLERTVRWRGWLVGWCLTALSAQKGLVPREKLKFIKDTNIV